MQDSLVCQLASSASYLSTLLIKPDQPMENEADNMLRTKLVRVETCSPDIFSVCLSKYLNFYLFNFFQVTNCFASFRHMAKTIPTYPGRGLQRSLSVPVTKLPIELSTQNVKRQRRLVDFPFPESD